MGLGTAAPVFCRATLNYAPVDPTREPTSADVDVLDARRADLPGWAACGFELFHHVSKVTDWRDDEEIAEVHYAELEALARELTGCEHALVSGHIKRSPEQAARHQDLAPIRFVHSDFAAGHDALIRRQLREAGPDSRAAVLARNGFMPHAVDEAGRLVILQFWRNLGPAKMDFPIAFCDARTVRPDDARAFRVVDYAGAGSDFEALAVTVPDEPERHQWYAFPELHTDEVVAFRTYDSELVRDGRTFFTPHSAFRDPDVAVGRPARSSIELRAICLYE